MSGAEDKFMAILKSFEGQPDNCVVACGIGSDPDKTPMCNVRDLRDLLAQRQWRPIESAPRDGTDVLVGRDHATVWIVHVAWYRDGSPGSGADVPEDIGWWSYVRHSVTQEKLEGPDEPTNWMPLPEPPT